MVCILVGPFDLVTLGARPVLTQTALPRGAQKAVAPIRWTRAYKLAPVFTGDVLTVFTKTAATGRSSVTVSVIVEAERYLGGEKVIVTHATVKMVSVNHAGHSVDFRTKPDISEHPHV